MKLVDSCQRRIEYLRLSVTDLCNIRCSYCMPLIPPSPPFSLRGGILTFDEIERLVRIFSGLGIRRVRLTGGEPLVRKDLPVLVRMLKKIPALEEVLLTTNGMLLQPLAAELKDAGLEKINVHLDTLSPQKFWQITRGGEIRKVLEGIDAAKRAGLRPIKLNAVVQKGVNDDEAENLLRFAADNGLILRFIELMPIGPARETMNFRYVPLDAIRRRLQEKYTLDVTGSTGSAGSAGGTGIPVGSGPAVYYRVKELGTVVGFISPVSQPFCKNCNRIRISSDGRFQDCLAYDGGFSLRDLLRDPTGSDERIAKEIAELLAGKRESHNNFLQGVEKRTRCMYGIGG